MSRPIALLVPDRGRRAAVRGTDRGRCATAPRRHRAAPNLVGLPDERHPHAGRNDTRRRLRGRERKLSRLQDGAGGCPSRFDLDMSGSLSHRRKGGRYMPNRSPRSGAGYRGDVVDLFRAPGDQSNHAGDVSGRIADDGEIHAASSRQSQPAARRPVLHGARQLASPGGHVTRERGSCESTCTTTTPSHCRAIRSNWSRDGSSRKKSSTRPRRAERKSRSRSSCRTDRRYLEAKVDRRALPAPMAAKIKFKADGPEERFDFTFTELSKEPIVVAGARGESRGG